MAAMRWAGGLDVPGIPTNPYPAKIINLSLGGSSTCTSAYQSIAAELAARGVLIVASAGNEGGSVSAPANCTGVLGVTGVRHVGTKVGFSNLGHAVDIAAPGGNCVNINGGPCLFSIVTTTNQGRTSPGASAYTDTVNFNVGTSFSAPLVAGTAALMHAVNAHLGPEELTARIRQGASSFPPIPSPAPTDPPVCRVPTITGDTQLECYCTTQTCGAGLLNANGAVIQALRPAAAIEVTGTVAPGQTVSLDANRSVAACNRTLSAFEWSVIAPTTNAPALSSTNQATTTIQAPSSGEVHVRLTVTDDAGAQDFVDLVIGPTSTSTATRTLVEGPACPTPIAVSQKPAPTPTPSPPSNGGGGGGGGGGGQFNPAILALILLVLASRRLNVRHAEGRLSSR
jgi:serine protease